MPIIDYFAAITLIEKEYVFKDEVFDPHLNAFCRVTYAGIPKYYACGCPTFTAGEAPYNSLVLQSACDHILAQHIAYLMGAPLSEIPIPFKGEPICLMAVLNETR